MSSRRKAASPCVARAAENTQENDSELTTDELSEKELSESSESEKSSQSQQDVADISDDQDDKENGDTVLSEEEGEKENQCPDAVRKDYRCKYCAFKTLNLSDFKDHVDANHPDVILNPLYLCVACNYETKKFDSLTEHNEREHPSSSDFKFKKTRMGNQTVLEQTVDTNEELSAENGDDTSCVTPAVMSPDVNEEIRAVSINGTVIIPEANVLQDSSHVSPMLQRPPNFSCVPKIAVPLNTSKYNPSLDNNVTLIASFNKFPYPTHAELSWLTAASKHPEEQIRVWFTTQRLKQGITWSPEEVEEARKKMFNGSVPAPHSTVTVLPTSPVSKLMVRTTTVESPSNALKRNLNGTTFGPEPKRPVMAVAPNPGEKGLMAPPLMPLKSSLEAKWANANDIKRTPVPLIQAAQTSQKNKVMPNVPNILKTRPIMSMPSMVFPESLTRPMIAPPPIFAPPFKNNILVPRANEKVPISLPNGTLPNSVPLIPPQIRRPAIIQSIRGAPNVPGFPTLDGTKEQNCGELNKASYNGKWAEPLDDPKCDFQQKAQVLTQFPLLERMKGKTSEQLKVLEENFLRNSFPTHSDVETLASSTKLSPTEIDSWFSERRALRDNLEQALLNSMGTKRNGSNVSNDHGVNGLSPVEKVLQNGVHKAAEHVELNLRGVSGPDELIGPRWSFVDDPTNRWFDSDGKTGSVLSNAELIGPRCYDSANGSNGQIQEAELNWFNKTLYNRLDVGSRAVFGRWMERRPDFSEES